MNAESSPGPLGRLRETQNKRLLGRVLRERGVLSTAHAVDIALDICDALSTAHASGVVHGELGPASVRLLYTPEAGPRGVEIFSLAGEEDSGVAALLGPLTGPEPGQDPRNDVRVDVRALGALVHVMVVGAPPASGGLDDPERRIPTSLAPILEACLTRDPAAGLRSVDDLAEKIASFATSPPERFVALAERRERRERAARVRQSLERRGLSEMPGVLDKLDDAALARAHNDTRSVTSQPVGTTSEAALQRLMSAVREGTEAARVELATHLPSLVDFDGGDPDGGSADGGNADGGNADGGRADGGEGEPAGQGDGLPTVVQEETARLVPVASPLPVAHVVLPEAPPPSSPSLASAPARRGRAPLLAALLVGVFVLCAVAGYAGYAMRAPVALPAQAALPASVARPAALPAQAALPASVALPVALPAQAPSATATAIPVFVPSDLPDSPPVTPASLPEAR